MKQGLQRTKGLWLKEHHVVSSFELALRFAFWWEDQREQPSIQKICDEWCVHRSTAYRWREAYLAAKGVAS